MGAALFISTFNGPGTIDLTDSMVRATRRQYGGPGVAEFVAQHYNILRLSGGSLISDQSTAIEAQGPVLVTVTNGAVVTGGGGFLLEAFDSTSGHKQPMCS